MSTKPEKDPAVVAAAWLAQAQGVRMPVEAVAAPARMAGRLEAVAREAAADLRFGMEPSGFQRIFAALADGDDDAD